MDSPRSTSRQGGGGTMKINTKFTVEAGYDCLELNFMGQLRKHSDKSEVCHHYSQSKTGWGVQSLVARKGANIGR